MTDELLWKIHSGLPREAPGSDFSTLRSFQCMHDKHQPFLDELNRRAAEKGLTERIKTLNISMFNLLQLCLLCDAGG